MSQFEQFDPKSPGATEYFEFTANPEPGITVNSAVWSIVQTPANDADSPLAILDQQFSSAGDGTVMVVLLTAGVYGRYLVQCLITLSDGEVVIKSFQLDIEDT